MACHSNETILRMLSNELTRSADPRERGRRSEHSPAIADRCSRSQAGGAGVTQADIVANRIPGSTLALIANSSNCGRIAPERKQRELREALLRTDAPPFRGGESHVLDARPSGWLF
jgi:hypothetical protein